MSTNYCLQIKLKDFPNSVAGFNELFCKENIIPNHSEYKFFFLKDCQKHDINDLIIPTLKKDLRSKGNEEIIIYCEKIDLKVKYIDALSESIVISNSNKASFEEVFELVCKDMLENIQKNDSVDAEGIIERHDFYGYKRHFDNFQKIISFFNKKVKNLEMEREVSAMVLSNYEDNIFKIEKENERKKNECDNILIINKLNYQSNNNPQLNSSENIVKLENITKSIRDIQNDLVVQKAYFNNKEISRISTIKPLDLLPNNDLNNKLRILDEELKNLHLFTNQIIDSLDLNKSYKYMKNSAKKVIFCNLCNDFKKMSNQDLKICERHEICESCNKNYSKKIKFLIDKICYCKQSKV